MQFADVAKAKKRKLLYFKFELSLLYYTQNPQKYQSLFAKFSVLRKKAENPGTAAPQPRGLECEKVLTPTGFFAILYKVYHGDVSKRS